ncbi:S1 RNA-binding domain-containing protein [Desulfofundulus thermocisternus]|uniref:S1 RNA-binding domain-containing protein n=1 Tax=Desulfofundulus thermocisternus TaxID=42471 RepID=UPI00217DCFA0|nr:S1 RNA-binding domain-containing protein [Desulfofundulus thermocisternus]MCS5696978.1 S1 RNA-binding domain-containing protein [Desulfofundulus thermocisternus]
MAKKTLTKDVWPEIYGSMDNRSVIYWPVVGKEEIRRGEEKMPCLVVMKERVKGIIPIHESGITGLSDNPKENDRLMSRLLGHEIPIIVTDIIDEETFVASRAKALQKIRAATWPTLEEGQVRTATVLGVGKVGCIVDIGGIEALLPVSEISHGWIDEVWEIFQPGDQVDVKLITVDRENEKLIVSTKALIPNPWPDCLKRYRKQGEYTGSVTGCISKGIFVSLEPGVDVYCHHTKFGQPQKGDMVLVKLTWINEKEQRMRGYIKTILRKAKTA